jgi:hypothetical protein
MASAERKNFDRRARLASKTVQWAVEWAREELADLVSSPRR